MTKRAIRFSMNHRKSLECILFIAQEMNGVVNKYNLMKVLYEADKFHLNNYAKPVTGDVYIAMEYGTVPSNIKNIVDFVDADLYLTESDLNCYPFTLEKMGKVHLIKGDRDADMDYLSETDVEALRVGIEKYGGKAFDEVKHINHQESAWVETEMNRPIRFEDMIEDPEIVEELQEIGEEMVI